jgi:hypothetical protein
VMTNIYTNIYSWWPYGFGLYVGNEIHGDIFFLERVQENGFKVPFGE